MYYDKEGKEISALTWAALSDLVDYRFVKQDRLSDYKVSTIWIGLSLDELFETAILCDEEDDFLHGTKNRSKSLEEAMECHKVAICTCVETTQEEESCDLSEKIDECNERIDEVIENQRHINEDVLKILNNLEYSIRLLTLAVNRIK